MNGYDEDITRYLETQIQRELPKAERDAPDLKRVEEINRRATEKNNGK